MEAALTVYWNTLAIPAQLANGQQFFPCFAGDSQQRVSIVTFCDGVTGKWRSTLSSKVLLTTEATWTSRS